MNEGQVAEAIRAKWKNKGCIVLTQVRNGVGFDRATTRTADALAVSTWPSRGLYAEGFEIKVSKYDLKRELAMPEKAEAIAQFCRHWWVAAPAGLIDESFDIPQAWGIVEVDGKLTAKIVKPAPVLTEKPMDSLFVCSVLRNFAEGYVPSSDIQKLAAPLIEKAKADAISSSGERLKKLERAFQKFKEVSGVDLLTDYGHPIWNIEGVAGAVGMLMNLRSSSRTELGEARRALAGAEAALAVAEKLLFQTVEG